MQRTKQLKWIENTGRPNKGNHIKRVSQNEDDDENLSKTHVHNNLQTQKMDLCS